MSETETDEKKSEAKCLFKLTYPDDRLHLRQWLECLNDFKEVHVNLQAESRTVRIRGMFGSGKGVKLLALIALYPGAHRTFYLKKKNFEFWIDPIKLGETLRHTRKANVVHHITSFQPGNSIGIYPETILPLSSNSEATKKLDALPGKIFELPISSCNLDGISGFHINDEIAKKLLNLTQPYTVVSIPTRQLKSFCLRLGPIKSLDDESAHLFHVVKIRVEPNCLTFSAISNYRAQGQIEVSPHQEDGKSFVKIQFAKEHPPFFEQYHHLYSLFLFCRNQHPVSEYTTLAFAPNKTLLLFAESPKIACRMFHLIPLEAVN